MKITAINAKKTGTTKTIVSMLINEVKKQSPDTEITEFCVADSPPCIGCFSCFSNGEDTCPHYDYVHPIITAIEDADVVILAAPNYCMGIPGAMKCFLDHMAYRWFSHRPHPSMERKLGVAISTTGSVGAGPVTKAFKKQFFGWTLAQSYRLHFAVFAFDTSWSDFPEKRKQKIEKHIKKTAAKLVRKSGKGSRSPYLRFILRTMRIVQRRNTWFRLDKAWWQEQGWIKGS